MRAHSQRRLIWILNVVLAVGVVAMVAWIVLDVRQAVADPVKLKPAFATDAVERFQDQPPTNRSALKPPVSQTEVEEIDRREFRTPAGKRFHWLYSGPMPPPPPEETVEEVDTTPVEDDLEKLGRVALMIFIGPQDGEETASETVVFWEFKEGGERIAFSPGEFIRPKKADGRGGIKLIDVKPIAAGSRTFELHYEVYKKDDQPPVKVGGVYVYDGNKALAPDIARRIKEPAKAAPGGARGSRAAGEPGSTAGVTSTQPGEALPPGEVPSIHELEPEVEWKSLNQAEIGFDQKTIDYFRNTDPDTIAKTVKTQVARDPNSGKVLGLQITGISAETPADRFDVKPGDILVSINNQAVMSRSDAMNIVQGLSPDTPRVTVVVDRRGRLITFDIDPRDPDTRRRARALENR